MMPPFWGSFFGSSQFVFILLLKSTDVFCLTTNEKETRSCSVYLADSSIDKAGFGVFAGREFNVGDHIGEGGLGIQIIDPNEEDFQSELISNYVKNSYTVGGDGEAQYVLTLLPGLSMLVNFHPDLVNVIGSGLSEASILDRKHHHGAGAITSYHNFTLIAKKYVKQGEELFFDLPEEWYQNREGDNTEDVIPVAADYHHADKLVKDLVNYIEKHPTLSESLISDVLLRIKTEMLQNMKSLNMLIPDTLEGLIEGAKGTARALLNDRPMDWIEENGKCLDNLKPGPSTIPGAGRGAFATRFIPKGSVIVPCPLIHITKKEILLMASNTTKDSNSKYQLLMNYCFGHRNSSLLLCPTTSAALINHDSVNFNAVYKWAAPSTNKQKEENYRMRPMEYLEPQSSSLSEYNSKLAFDFIATRDVFEGEEIFIDYGKEWMDAWETHVKVWRREESAGTYVPASSLNADESEIDASNEGTFEYKHHSHLCELEPFARDEDPEFKTKPPEEDYNANPNLNRSNWDESISKLYLENEFLWWWPCEVEAQEEGKDLYNVRVFQRKAEVTSERSVIRIIKNFPRKSIKFIDTPYHSDQHLSNAFRHFIPIPDDIFPLHWRNDYDSVDKHELGVKGSDDSPNDEVIRNFERSLREAKCGVYMATSTIPNAGKGLYLGVTVPSKGLDLLPRVPVIPVTDFTAQDWDAYDYTWSAHSYLAEFESDSVQILAINAGALANFHPGLVNSGLTDNVHQPILDRRKDPGAGAFSDYWNVSIQSLYGLEAGQELFISYGETWLYQRPQFDKVPLSSNYAEANSIISSLIGLSSGSDSFLKGDQVGDLLDIIKDDIILDERTKNVFASLQTLEDLESVTEKNGTAELTSERRSMEWLEKNGQCLDHIYVKNSTIPQAGKGAFALRFISRGSAIISSPMLNSWGRDVFDIENESIGMDINGKHLVYNYMWAHPESSLLLFPLTTAFAINHASYRNMSDLNPNAEIRWSQTDKKSMYYQQSDLENLKKEKYATLVLDFVATRNILPDEEILIDYGKAWEDRWNEHAKNFQSPCTTNMDLCLNSSLAVSMMNHDKFNSTHHSWGHSYFSVCLESSKPTDTESMIILIPTNESFESGSSAVHSSKYSFKGINYNHHGFELAQQADSWYPCMILSQDKEKRTFEVVYFTSEKPKQYDGAILRRAYAIGENDIRFINKPYMSDMHWNKAFRQEMRIPDHIFPVQWKDLSK